MSLIMDGEENNKLEQQIYDGLCPRCVGDVEHVRDTFVGDRKYETKRCTECGLIFDVRLRRVLVAEYPYTSKETE